MVMLESVRIGFIFSQSVPFPVIVVQKVVTGTSLCVCVMVSPGAPNLLIVCYEEIHKDPHKQIRRIAEFLGVDLTPELVDSIAEQTLFKNMKKNPAANMHWTDRYREDEHGKFMRKGKVGDWRNHFTEEQSARMDALIAERIPSDCGLVFDFGDE